MTWFATWRRYRSATYFRSVADALPACHLAAIIVPFDRGGDRAAAFSRADGDASRANPDGGTRIPPIAMGAFVTDISVAIDVSVATHLDLDLGYFQIFGLGRDNPAK